MRAITYKEGTESGKFSQKELDKFRRMMRVDDPTFEFDPSYLAFIKANNGGEPTAPYFPVSAEDSMTIECILNFTAPKNAKPNDDLFNVHETWNWIEDRLNPGMFPFASLPGGDFLLFDHSTTPAQIVYWYHERSTEGRPDTTVIAKDFESFVSMLRSKP